MIKSVRLTNFFSFRDCEITLEPDVTVLVGINGSGKTNLLRAFELLKAGMERRLREKVSEWGGKETVQWKGKIDAAESPKRFTRLSFITNAERVVFYHDEPGDFLYSFGLPPYSAERLENAESTLSYLGAGILGDDWVSEKGVPTEKIKIPVGAEKLGLTKILVDHEELALPDFAKDYKFEKQQAAARALSDVALYSDFDTRPKSPMRNSIQATGLDVLAPDGGNLFQILNTIQLKSTEAGDAIERDLQAVSPNFERLQFQPLGQGGMLTYLREVGLKTPIPAAHVSDGTLRYLCLLAIAHNPDRGRLICLDEPERGLHPDMLAGVARLLLDDGHANPEAPRHTSYVVATHSPQLLSHFPLRCLRVFEKDENNQTVVRQFTEEQFKEWYDTFDAGSMWMKGDLGGTRY